MTSGNNEKFDTVQPAHSDEGRSLWGDAWRSLRRQRGAMICLGVIAFYAVLAIGGGIYEYVAAYSQEDEIREYAQMADADRTYLPPRAELSWEVLGTDWEGKPILIKTLLGARVSMSVGLIANVIAVPLGIALGVIAGYYGGKVDSLIVWLFSTLASIPGIILLISLKFAFKGITVMGVDLSGIYGMYLALGVVSWIGTCRLVRAETLKVRELDYVLAAKATGRWSPAILLRHIVPNIFHIGIIRFSIGFVTAVQSEVILSYLGLGVGSGQPSWGRMIDSARSDLYAGRWWELSAAVGALFILVLALNIFGDRLRDALDPRLRGVRK